MEFVQILGLSFRASMINNTSTTRGLCTSAYRTHKDESSTKQSLQSGSHMFLNVPDELRLVPSLLDVDNNIWDY